MLHVIIIANGDLKLTKDQVQVSIFCIAFNHEKYIRQCLDGFLMQKERSRRQQTASCCLHPENSFSLNYCVFPERCTIMDSYATINGGYNMKILLVEDEIGLAEAVGSILKSEKYDVDICNDGISGLEAALTDQYDCILLDIMLPGMNGLDLLSTIRVKEIETPVLLLTARSETEDKINGLDCGADDYLTKPFSMGELLARIRAATRRRGIVHDINPKYGDIILDLKRDEIICGSNSVVLGRKEFQMLELLISNAGQITTKEQFMNKVWGYNDESEYNNVEVYISFLRKKLSMLHSSVQIKTRRGIGYFLDGAK